MTVSGLLVIWTLYVTAMALVAVIVLAVRIRRDDRRQSSYSNETD